MIKINFDRGGVWVRVRQWSKDSSRIPPRVVRLLTSRIPSTAAEEGEVCVSAARLVAARSFP